MTIVWPGTPGDAYVNTGETILYQLVCAWINTCGACAQYNGAIAKWWPKFHRGCNCTSVPIYPGSRSSPYQDWHEIIKELPPADQLKLVGKANLQLIDAGVVEWSDVVTSNRVRLLREVVSIEGLTVRDMTRAGVKKSTAEAAYATVNTPDHILAQRQRTELIKQIADLGIQPQHLQDIFGDIMARRIGIGAGPSGASEIPPGKSDAQWVEILMRSFRPGPAPAPTPTPAPAPAPAPAPSPAPKPLPRTLEEFAQEAITAAQSVPPDIKYTDTKVWIIDAFAEFKKTYPAATIADFKASLVTANIARLITLARFDVPGQLSKELLAKDAASEIKQGLATFHQIRLP